MFIDDHAEEPWQRTLQLSNLLEKRFLNTVRLQSLMSLFQSSSAHAMWIRSWTIHHLFCTVVFLDKNVTVILNCIRQTVLLLGPEGTES